MRRSVVLLLMGVLGLAGCKEEAPLAKSAAQNAAPVRKEFKYLYTPPKNPELQKYYEWLKQENAGAKLEPVLKLINWPAGLTIETKECGVSNAYYWPGKAEIVVCYELFKDFHDKSETEMAKRTPEYRRKVAIGGVRFLILHEVGHAVYDIFKVPVIGNPEDAADAFALYMLLKSKDPEVHWVLQGAKFFFMKNHTDFTSTSDLEFGSFADAHPLHQQRYFNMLCDAYGSSTKRYGFLVEKGFLPKGRAESCPQDWKRLDYAMEKLVAPYFDMAEVRKLQSKKYPEFEPEAYDASAIQKMHGQGS
ncbi:DUF4344 domain-containing metallopeptidase [Chitiniphilus eburneus]|uniref:Uncharacterized protein n=1 Tax=Chitiniphilus eburneus TaxID=2571148 RepID=A0A4U0Q084_9NEIS|nr:DUF4344 domain-containing metallopeptidase [Chitiniphilus eburneus]TJZ69014.1 hypothetical protein FAZ21_15205 [Chitiniphilus eburneus]